MPEELIGKVSNYFAKPMVAAIELSSPLKRGETIRIKGASTDLTVVVESMQIDRNPVESADAGASVGIKIPERARGGDDVFRVTEE